MNLLNEIVALPTAGLIAFSGLLGIFIGSFINVIIARVPKILERQWQAECASYLKQKTPDQSAQFNCCYPASHCPHCQHKLHWLDLIPIISYFCLKGRCRYCKQSIAWQYPLVEILSGLLWIIIVQHFGISLTTLAYLILSEYLLALSFIDLNTQLLPDNLTLPLLWLGLIWSLVSPTLSPSSAILGAFAGYTIPWSLAWLFLKIRRKEGMGYGDFKLFAALGAWLGVNNLPLLILLAALLGLIFSLGKILLTKSSFKDHYPFGPAIALAGWLLLIVGEPFQLLFNQLLFNL
jgi:leader peptidase (prepilin peptidase) / N-methyltransferase